MFVFFFKQKTAYEMRISDWSSDVCSSDLSFARERGGGVAQSDCKSPSTDAPRAHCALIGVAGSLEAMLEPFALTDLGGFELAPRTVEFGLLLRERGTFLLMPLLGVRKRRLSTLDRCMVWAGFRLGRQSLRLRGARALAGVRRILLPHVRLSFRARRSPGLRP